MATKIKQPLRGGLFAVIISVLTVVITHVKVVNIIFFIFEYPGFSVALTNTPNQWLC